MGRRTVRIAQVCALLLLPLGMLGGLTACQTRLVGQKTQDYEPLARAGNGIPFRLSKPVFVVRKNLDATGKIKGHSLEVVFESDPQAVYWVQVDPALFHSNTLKLTFADDGNGVLKAVDSDSADQSQGFLRGIGTFALGAVGLYAAFKGNAVAASLGLSGAFAARDLENAGLAKNDPTATADLNQILGDALSAVDQVAAGDPEWALAREPLETAMIGGDEDLLLQARAVAPRAVSLLSHELEKRFFAALAATGTILGGPDRLSEFRAGPWDEEWLARLVAELAKIQKGVQEQIKKLLAEVPPKTAEADRLRSEFTKGVFQLAGLLQLLLRIGPAEDVWQKALVELRNKEYSAERRKDLEAGAVRPSDDYRKAEAKLYVALDMQDELRQLRALEDYLDRVYAEFGRSAPKGKRLAEVIEARRQRDAIEGAMATALANILSPPPASGQPACDAPSTYNWVGDGSDVAYPRWVRFTGPAEYPRDQWLTEYMCANGGVGGGPPKSGELVVLLERSAPTQEVLPAPYLAPFSKEIPCR